MRHKSQNKTIAASFQTIMDVMNTSFIEQFLGIIEKYADHFGVKGYTTIHKGNPRLKTINNKFIIEELWRVSDQGRGLPWIDFIGRKPYGFNLSICVGDGRVIKDRYHTTDVTARVDRDYFIADSEELQRHRLDTYLALCKDIYCLTKPLCGDCHEDEDDLAISASLSKRGIFRFFGFAYSTEYGHIELPHIDCPITGIYWANYLGPSCVEFFGRERLLNAPGVVNREDLDGGGMLLFTAPHLLTPNDPIHRANQLALWDYLGLRPKPNLKVIAKYYSSDRFKGALPSYEP